MQKLYTKGLVQKDANGDITITDVTAGAYTPSLVLGYKVNDGTAHSGSQFLRVAHDSR